MPTNKELVSKMTTYAVLQVVVEHAVLNVDGMQDVDMSRLSPYIFNGIVSRASSLQTESTVN